MSEELMAMIESLVQEHYGTQGLEYLRQRTRPAPAVQVPDGFFLCPVRATDEMQEDMEAALIEFGVNPEHAGEIDKQLVWLDTIGSVAGAAPAPATVATEAVSASEVAGVKRYIQSCAEQVGDSVWGHLLIIDRLAAAASVATEAVAQGGGVDVALPAAIHDAIECLEDEAERHDSHGMNSLAEGCRARAHNLRAAYRALLSASPAGVGGWIPVSERLPEAGKGVLAYYKNSHGYGRIVRAFYATKHTLEANSYDDDGQFDYDEATDTSYLPEGWLEKIDNWGDFSSIYIVEGEVTHWQPLPAAPAIANQEPQDGR